MLEKLLLSGFILFSTIVVAQNEPVMLGEVEVIEDTISKAPYYNTTARLIDVLHMDLDLQLDWGKHAILGQADVYVKPYFYDIDSVTLDAKGFKWNRVALIAGGVKKDIEYNYNGQQIHLKLDKNYKRDETIHFYFDYVALPDSLGAQGGSAIRDAKGFYFIDSSATRMQQFWTQGEPESNSAWFPTIDKPYEKITHRIGITVDTSWVTLSNGELEFRTDNGDGTLTDYWTMEMPHAPYLVMLAGGNFDTVGTKWSNKPVRYFVEPEWKNSAERIFGVTPTMITYFSGLLNFPYPWPKYDQIVVRDYVSGAMENTTATVHGDFLYTNPRAFADNNHEDIIAHELFHQWFGDVVTCESWGHLPLNESFATYGEILWKEWKHGPDEADWHAQNDLNAYLSEFGRGKAVKMIRPDFEVPLEMFDSHSYAKGGRILKMLRRVVGDDAFFASLNKYLVDNAYQAAEISDLRKALEETTGQDLAWFFDQWFLAAGHPIINVEHSFDRANWKATIKVKQVQDLTQYPTYRLPVTVAIYTRKEVIYKEIVITAENETFEFDVESEPRLVRFDAENYLLAEINVTQNDAYWLYQLGNCEQALDRLNAAAKLIESKNVNLRSTVAGIAMDDKFWTVKLLGLQSASTWDETGKKKLESTVKKLLKDENPNVRAEALVVWSEVYGKQDEKLYRENLDYLSYRVNGAAMKALGYANKEAAVQMALDSVQFGAEDWTSACTEVVATFGDKQALQQMDNIVAEKSNYEALIWYYLLGKNLNRGGEASMAITDILAMRANDESNRNSQYYSYRFLVDNTERLKEEMETASPEAAKKLKAIVKYAEEKLEELEEEK